MHAAITSKGKIARFSARPKGGSGQLDSGFDRMCPEGNHLHRETDPRLVGREPVLFDEVASDFAKTITFGIALEGQAKNDAEARETKCAGVAYSILEGQIHHFA